MTPTKKVVRKVVAGKVSRKTVQKVKRVSAEPVSEVFSTRPASESVVEVPAGTVALFVNGRQKGTVHIEGQKLGAFAVAAAQREGITSFSLYVDNQKATTRDKDKSMAQISKVEIVSKDARG